ncbi:MAG TPA: hypothetical protein VFU54_15550 [Actinomycetota bacterium]|nr:hypothetical protein [Actinomycetota bacterium]
MSLRVERPDAGTDRPLQVLIAVTVAVTAVAVLFLARAALGDRVGYRTVRVDNQAGLPLQVDAVDATGGTMGLGEAGPRSATSFQEVADLGRAWTFVASYGGREVARQRLSGRELAERSWTVQVPSQATADLEAAGFQ